jgi:uncharacterized GH25 family protein
MTLPVWGLSVLRGLLAAALIVLTCPVVRAHDMWIEPTTFSPQTGQGIGLRLRVGVDLVGDALLRDPALIQEFVYVDAAGRKPVTGIAGDDPAGALRVAAPTRRNETGTAVRERFSRCAKSLVLSGPASDAQGDRVLGFTLELVAERNPYALRPGQELPLRLTYQNRPLAGALVVAINSLDPARKQALRTGNDGRVRFQLRPGGLWLIKAVHMVRAPIMSKADWMSYWASLTFTTGRARETNAKGSHG